MSAIELLQQVKQLSPREQLLFAEQILAGLVQQMPPKQAGKQKLKPLLGLWHGFTVTEDDIAEARHEMWGNFGERDSNSA